VKTDKPSKTDSPSQYFAKLVKTVAAWLLFRFDQYPSRDRVFETNGVPANQL
jgi:hypothetical protein